MEKSRKNILANVSSFQKKAFLLTAVFTAVGLFSIVIFVFISPRLVSGIRAVDESTWEKHFRYYVNTKDWDGLYEQALLIIDKVPDMAGAHYMAGIASENLEDLEKAATHYKAAVKFAPGNIAYYYSCANTLFAMGDLDGAEKYFLDGYKLKYGEFIYLFNRQLGYVYYGKVNYPEADKYFALALQEKPDEPDLYLKRGEIALHQLRYTIAVEYLEKGIALEETNMRIMKLLMEAYIRNKRPRDAAGAWRNIQGRNIRRMSLVVNWGNSYLRQGEAEMARKFYDVVLLMDHDNPGALMGMRAYENYIKENPAEQKNGSEAE